MPDDKWQIQAELLSSQFLSLQTPCSINSTRCPSRRGNKTNADYFSTDDEAGLQYQWPQFAWIKIFRFKTLHINAGFFIERTIIDNYKMKRANYRNRTDDLHITKVPLYQLS